MPHRPKSKFRPRKQKHIDQDSPFLELPGEVRTLIYRAALVKPGGIKLWPDKYITNPHQQPHLAARLAKASLRMGESQASQYSRRIRDQEDLQYVRKEMATGLLGTCWPIRNEAMLIFWAENTFKFSNDLEWEGLRRFLTSIGPYAIQRLSRIEVFAPLQTAICSREGILPEDDVRSICNAKNEPKLRMCKLYRKGTDTLYANIQHIAQVLKDVEASFDLVYVIPSGWSANAIDIINNRVFDPELIFPEEMRDCQQRLNIEMRISAGGCFYGREAPQKLVERCNVDLVVESGAYWFGSNGPHDDSCLVTDDLRWVSPENLYSYLEGVKGLFEDTTISVAASAGKVKKPVGAGRTVALARKLKGFGGCQFVYVDAFQCFLCRHVVMNRDRVVRLDNLHCPVCGRWSLDEKIQVLEPKNKARYERFIPDLQT